jgi:acyl carrier protein
MHPISKFIADSLGTILGVAPDGLAESFTFEELDIDSLVLVELSVMLENRYAVVIDEGEIMPTDRISDVTQLVTECIAAA